MLSCSNLSSPQQINQRLHHCQCCTNKSVNLSLQWWTKLQDTWIPPLGAVTLAQAEVGTLPLYGHKAWRLGDALIPAWYGSLCPSKLTIFIFLCPAHLSFLLFLNPPVFGSPWWHTYSQLIDYSTAIIIRSAFVSLITRSSHQYCGKVAIDFQVWYYQCFWNIMCHFTLCFILPLQAVGFIQQNRTEPRPHYLLASVPKPRNSVHNQIDGVD